MPDPYRDIAAHAQFLAEVDGEGRAIFIEDALRRLISIDPALAVTVADFLCAAEGLETRHLAESVRSHLTGGAALTDRKPIDVLIVAPKEVEEGAVLRAMDMATAPIVRSRRARHIGHLSTVEGLRILVASPKRDGNTRMALFTEEWLATYSPRLAVLVGMAGGRAKNDIDGSPGVVPGDVVVSEVLFDYQFARLVKDDDGLTKRVNRSLAHDVDPDLTINLSSRDMAGWVRAMKGRARAAMTAQKVQQPTRAEFTAWGPTVKPGGILSGSWLIEDDSIGELAKAIHDRALAIEMEGAGFVAACKARNVPWFSLRGIADMGGHPDYVAEDATRPKHWQFLSTFAAADYLRTALTDIGIFNT